MTSTSAPGAGGAPLLDVEGLSRSFGGVRAVDGVSFQVHRGHIKGIIGPNGAGKSTLLNLLGGALRPDRGTIRMNEVRLDQLAPHQVPARGIARTFQLVRLFSNNGATVLDNVLLGAHLQMAPSIIGTLFRRRGRERAIREKARGWLDFFGLAAFESQSPGNLPFGRQRYVELARAMMLEPQLLLLDEPASGLNDAEVAAFAQVLRRIRSEGQTIVLVEHNMKLIMDVTDEILVLAQGRRLADGHPAAIRHDPAVVEAYLGTPAESV